MQKRHDILMDDTLKGYLEVSYRPTGCAIEADSFPSVVGSSQWTFDHKNKRISISWFCGIGTPSICFVSLR